MMKMRWPRVLSETRKSSTWLAGKWQSQQETLVLRRRVCVLRDKGYLSMPGGTFSSHSVEYHRDAPRYSSGDEDRYGMGLRKTRLSIDRGVRRRGSLRTILAFSFALAFALALPIAISGSGSGSSIGTGAVDLSQYKSPGGKRRPCQPGHGQHRSGCRHIPVLLLVRDGWYGPARYDVE
ncbi:hypothetical protein LY76DRAFT_328244 [Colletotrichum caudatum]|nr:hypothetical protein LY76DRAFT_328244 [Colletotrichum caudatum]